MMYVSLTQYLVSPSSFENPHYVSRSDVIMCVENEASILNV